jgi:hypothetical protein
MRPRGSVTSRLAGGSWITPSLSTMGRLAMSVVWMKVSACCTMFWKDDAGDRPDSRVRSA